MAEMTEPGDLVHLEEQRDFLLRSLDDLERERDAGDIEPEDYRTLRDDYTARAAAVLRAIDVHRGVGDGGAGRRDGRGGGGAGSTRPGEAGGWRGSAATVARSGVRGGRPSRGGGRSSGPSAGRSLRRAAVIGGIAIFAVVAGLLVAGGSGERLTGQPSSGSITATGASDDVGKAQQQFADGRLLDSLKTLNGVLAKEPNNVPALTYLGWFTRITATELNHPELIDKALSYLDKAESTDPTYAPAHVFRGILLFEDKHQPAAAIPEFQTFLAAPHSGDEQAMVPLVEQQLSAALAATGPTTTTPTTTSTTTP